MRINLTAVIYIVLLFVSCDNVGSYDNSPSKTGCLYDVVSIPMPNYDDVEKGDTHIEKSVFLGWSPSGKFVCYMKEKSGLGMAEGYTVHLILQNTYNDNYQILKEFYSDYETPESLQFNDLFDLFNKNKEEIVSIISKSEIAPSINTFNNSNSIMTNNESIININISKNKTGVVSEFSFKVTALNNHSKWTIASYKSDNDSFGATDIKYLGFFTNCNKKNALVIAYVKSREIEGAVLYSPIYVGCSLQ
ncbi:MAG: hypothetical protein JKY08_04180 [Flavobacteriaceae bacterium]|nr:hypothetical protein [Flavobacteriaceae bacterium]